MYKWFECKVKYDKQEADGTIKSSSETYLVDAQSFTEAEARIIIEMKPYISGEFEVANIRRIKITELFNFDDNVADKWYKAKVNFVTIDEDKGVEKRTASTMMVKGEDIKSALDALIKGMENGLTDYEIANIAETPIMDVYEYAPVANVTPVDNRPVPPTVTEE